MNPTRYIAFCGHTLVATGSLAEVARVLRLRLDEGEMRPAAIFDGATGRPTDVDLRGAPDEVAERAAARQRAEEEAAAAARSGPGRPRLGVVAREVTLLPRHWDWLNAQPGGASVTLRKLVETARKQGQASERVRCAQDVAYRLMYGLAGDLPGFEEATRSLYAWDLPKVRGLVAAWPQDVRELVLGYLEQSEGPRD